MKAADIRPDTKVGDLLRAHPELEATLIALSPEFRRLQNPVLRATVAKVATLQQVARVGGITVATVVNALRQAAGFEEAEVAETIGAGCGDRGMGKEAAAGALGGPAPAWFDPAAVTRTFDARPIIEQGQHPLAQVMQQVNALAAEKILELITPFEPAPLIDKVCALGFHAWVRQLDDGTTRTFFRRK